MSKYHCLSSVIPDGKKWENFIFYWIRWKVVKLADALLFYYWAKPEVGNKFLGNQFSNTLLIHNNDTNMQLIM